MGCSDLWRLLAVEGYVMSLSGSTRGDYERIVKEIQGKVLAVDLSVWLMEVKSLIQLRQSVRTETAAYLKVILEKVTNMLRMGCTPVIVLEGKVDESKYELMEKRYNRAYAKKHVSKRYGEIEKLLSALVRDTYNLPKVCDYGT